VAKTRAARIILVLPLVALYLWLAVINHFVADVPDLGVGIAFAFGGAGAALAAQARTSELGPQAADKQAISTARLTAQILAFAIVAGSVGTLIYSLVKSDAPLRPSLVMALLIIANGAVLAGPALATIFKNTAAWRALSIGLGISFLAILYFAGRGGSSLIATFEAFKPIAEISNVPVSFGVGIGLFLFPAFAAVVSAPAFARGATRNTELEERLDLAAITMRVLALVCASFAVTHLAWGILVEKAVLDLYPGNFRVESIVAGLLAVALVFVALAALRSFNKNPSGARPAVSLALVVSVIIGAVLIAVNPFGGTTIGQLLLVLAIPAIGAYALIGNKASRAFFAQSAARRPAPDVRSYQWTQQQRPVINAAKSSATSAVSAHTGATAVTDTAGAAGLTADTVATANSTRSTHSAATGAVASTSSFEPTASASVSESEARTEGETAVLAQDSTGEQSAVTAPVAVSENAEDIPDESTVAKVSAASPHDAQAIDRSELAALEEERSASVAGHGYTYEQAKDPATPAIVLAKIAELAPELRPALAENPSTYPALVEWLGQLGDPAVDAALGRRSQ